MSRLGLNAQKESRLPKQSKSSKVAGSSMEATEAVLNQIKTNSQNLTSQLRTIETDNLLSRGLPQLDDSQLPRVKSPTHSQPS